MNLTKPVILASGSPRRKELLALAGFNFTVCPAKGEEVTTKTLPYDIVCELAHQKAFEIAKAQTAPCYVIGADTIVAFENRILGKPKDSADAVRMVSMLQGSTHQVYTGVTLIEVCTDGSLREKSFYEETNVHVCQMTKDEIASYVATENHLIRLEPTDSGYFFNHVSGIEGDYFNVVGLPVSRLIMNLLLFKMLLANKYSALFGK
ncbi:MAG: Maf family protein [Lachnospiraceae bacterium]